MAVALVQYYEHFPNHLKVRRPSLATAGIKRENGKSLIAPWPMAVAKWKITCLIISRSWVLALLPLMPREKMQKV
jgi:hypothetical protein